MNWNVFYEICLYFFIYGFIGWGVEVAFHAVKQGVFVNRGFLNGPICPIYGVGVCIVVYTLTPYKSNLILLYMISTILVTALEFVTGWLLDVIFHNKWWDYSNMPLNIKGYVCLIFSVAWGVGCVIIVDFVHPLFTTIITHLPMVVGVILIIGCGIGMFADLYVTAAAIFKMNKRLARMDEIAAELHNISDEIGEGIYKEVMKSMERSEEASAKFAAMKDETSARLAAAKDNTTEKLSAVAGEPGAKISAEMRERMEGLYKGYREYTDQATRVQRRIVRAFPKMVSHRYEGGMEELRSRFGVLRHRKKSWKKEHKTAEKCANSK